MERIDSERLRYVVDQLNTAPSLEDLREEIGLGFWYEEEEDYGLDIFESGRSESGTVIRRIEVKTVTTRYDWDFYCTKACRNRKFRYGLTGGTPTQEEIEEDSTPRPRAFDKPIPLNVLNMEDKYGNYDNSKVAKMRKEKAGLIFLTERGILVFSHADMEEAIIGIVWQKLEHTRELGDRSVKWEKKAVIDMGRPTYNFKRKVPGRLING